MIKNKPEAYGISSDNLLCMVQELETFVEDIHSISVVCDNDVIFSKCIQPYTEEPMQMLHSFSKSMNSIAVGIAIDEGKLHLDDLVIDYFKEYLPEEYDKRMLVMESKCVLLKAFGDVDAFPLCIKSHDVWMKSLIPFI